MDHKWMRGGGLALTFALLLLLTASEAYSQPAPPGGVGQTPTSPGGNGGNPTTGGNGEQPTTPGGNGGTPTPGGNGGTPTPGGNGGTPTPGGNGGQPTTPGDTPGTSEPDSFEDWILALLELIFEFLELLFGGPDDSPTSTVTQAQRL